MRVVDRWTTQDGSWDVDPAKPYGIDQTHRDRYFAGRDIPGAGGNHHIFVKTKPNYSVQFSSRSDGSDIQQLVVGPTGWVNFPIFEGYNPTTSQGAWTVAVNMRVVATGIGLPGGEHVSTFLVVEDEPTLPDPPDTADGVRRELLAARAAIDTALELLGEVGN